MNDFTQLEYQHENSVATLTLSAPPVNALTRTLNVIEDMGLRDGYRYEQDMTSQIAKTDDAKEAQRAFAEKRVSVFTGC